MMIHDTYANTVRAHRPMTVEQAITHSMGHPSAETRNTATAAIVGRLLTVLHAKGILLPSELLTVIGDRYEEYPNGKAETPTR